MMAVLVDPTAPPVTRPELEPILAVAGVPLLHVPVPVASPSEVVAPAHTLSVPNIGVGVWFTVTILVAKHPVPKVNVIVAVPAVTPYTLPDASTVALELSLLVHTPPPPSENTVDCPVHTVGVPLIVPGSEFTVICVLALQPDGMV